MNELIQAPLLRPLRRRFIVSRAPGHNGAVALTFDDGPHPENTPRLLACLKETRAAATFFLLGKQIEACRHLAQEIAIAGHEIGIHSFSHSRMAEIGYKNYVAEIERTAALIRQYTCSIPLYFRPPYGERGMWLLWTMLRRRLRCILWSVDRHDYCVNDKDTLVRMIRETPLVSGDILLFHEYNTATVEALPAIIGDIRSRGLALTTVSGLLKKPSGHAPSAGAARVSSRSR